MHRILFLLLAYSYPLKIFCLPTDMGFFVVTMHRRVQIHPRFFGVKLEEMLKQRLILEVEGSFAGRYGFIVAVLQVMKPIPMGELEETTGFAVFPLQYQAVVFRPFKGEVLDTVVTKATQHGIFAESGPLTVFVSHHCLLEDMTFDAQHATWSTRDNVDRIKRDSSVRMRLIGLKIEATEISATGTVRDAYLGPLE